jgi:hypothetical protein
MSDYLENKLVDHLFRTTSFSKPAALHIGLLTAAPSDSSAGTEVSGGAYARVQRDPLDANWEATQGGTTGASSGTGGLTQNVAALTFPTPTANWGTVTHLAIFDAATAGNMLMYGTLANAKTINNGDPAPSFAAGQLDITFA